MMMSITAALDYHNIWVHYATQAYIPEYDLEHNMYNKPKTQFQRSPDPYLKNANIYMDFRIWRMLILKVQEFLKRDAKIRVTGGFPSFNYKRGENNDKLQGMLAVYVYEALVS